MKSMMSLRETSFKASLIVKNVVFSQKVWFKIIFNETYETVKY